MTANFRVDTDQDGNVEVSPAKPRKLRPIESDESEAQVAKPAVKSALKGAIRSPEPPPPPDPPSPAKSALKSAMKGTRPSDADDQSPAKQSAPKSAMKSALKGNQPLVDPEPPPWPALHPQPPSAPKPKSALKGRCLSSEKDDAPPMTTKVSDKRTTTSKNAGMEQGLSEKQRRPRPSLFKMNIEMIDPYQWSRNGLCKHYYHYAGQKGLWLEQEKACASGKQRKSIKLGDLALLHGDPKDKDPLLQARLTRSQSLIIEDDVEFGDPTAIVDEYAISPLKELFIAKKPDVPKIKALLDSLGSEVSKWINASLDATPPPMPAPLFHAVAAVDVKLIQLLVDYNVDTLTQYPGKSMLKGWIKPNTALVASVRDRKARFVGTMLGDKLEAIDAMLVRAQRVPANSQEAPGRPEVGGPKLKMAKSSSLSEGLSMGSRNSLSPRKSIQMRCSRGMMMHTQGHPNLKYELVNKFEAKLCSVREATDIDTGTAYAIKAGAKSWDATGKDPEAALWQEVGIMRKLDHPNIIKLYETFEDETHIFLVFEVCTGGELFDRLLLAEGGFPQSTATRLAYQMGSALRHLHELRICHRDIQPESFLVASESPLEETGVKLMDFITAKEIVNCAPLTTKICTLHYVAPEILTSETGYNEKVDIWSWAVLLYIMTAGQPPFNADHELDILAGIKAGTYSFSPANVWSDVNETLKDLIRKSLVVDPAQRLDVWGVMEHPAMVAAESSGAVYVAPRGNVLSSTKENSFNVTRSAFSMLAEKISDDQVDELRAIFRDLDPLETGMVDILDIRKRLIGMVSKKADTLNDAPDELMQVLTSESLVGKVNYTMCLATMTDKRRHIRREAARAVFNMFDIDKNGNISLYEIAQALGRGGLDEVSRSPSEKERALKVSSVSSVEVQAIWTEMIDVYGNMDLCNQELSFEDFFRQLPKANLDICF